MNFNIVIINDFAYVSGGGAQVALISATALAKRGHSVTVFAAVPPIDRNLIDANVKVVSLGQYDILRDPNRLRAAIQGIWNFYAVKKMKELLNTLNPSNTILHLHSWTSALSSSIVPIAIKRGFRIVCTIHDYSLACPVGSFLNHRRNDICHLSPLSFKCIVTNCDRMCYSHKLWRVVRNFIQRYFGLIPKGIKNFIAVSDFSKDIIQPFLPNDAKIYRVDNPIDFTKKEPIEVHKNSAFVFLGRFSKEKGVLLFAKASSILNIEAVFIGAGYLEEEIKSIYPSAKITGWLSRQEVQNMLSRARALVFPSLCYEASSLVVNEALAMGIPAIVSDTCAARDFVEDGVTGFWFKRGNLDDLIKKIEYLQNPETAKIMGQTAYTRYWQNPKTIDKHIRELQECYYDILKS